MSSSTMTATPVMTGARRRLKLFLFVIVLFMSWALYVLIVQHGQLNDRSGQLHEVNQKLTDAQAKNEALKQQVARLNDDEYLGQIARKEHGLGLPGEFQIEKE
ncbi:septum formation initiator family protein [Cohnella endophytica]|uniref:Septum formation initiator family protein n=1 Tax=Cohnella endophytica TaxID=2419778 RepID=A0A494X3Z7_9BACL|nr:septum formation initiator family protein [Cohnella endophytica]RKP45415.1 septum formation initiator family protein [Cohnella endophytica]